ncbi:MAG: nucleotidyltransferase domain-containing protein [Actinobacteria bacterium]|nr:nucleotidyltransferase domain-containing protein [Actinomycetota bacterium]
MGGWQSEDLIEQIKEFLKSIGAEEAILFGSRARGDELETSDVDLIVIDDKFAGMPFPRRLIYLSQRWNLSYFLEAFPYTHEEFEKLSKTRGVVADAAKHGIRIKVA